MSTSAKILVIIQILKKLVIKIICRPNIKIQREDLLIIIKLAKFTFSFGEKNFVICI